MKSLIKILTIVLLALLCFILIMIWNNHVSNNKNIMKFSAPESMLTYEKAIDSINYREVELIAVSDLLRDSDFLCLITHSDKYISEALNYLSNPSKDEQSKIIVVYSMQNLCYKNYISFFKSCSELYKKGLISDNILLHVIIPGSDWNNKIANSFYKSDVRKVLKEIKLIKSNSEDLINVINYALKGKLWWHRLTR